MLRPCGGAALDSRLADVVHLTRDDLLELSGQFQHRGQPEKAVEAKRAWVKAKEERLTKAGRPSDFLQAAHEYQSLLDDSDSAARLLMEASKSAPDVKEISSQLERLGFKRVNGKWLTAAQVAAIPADPFQKAAEAGRYTGMTREQIRKTYGPPRLAEPGSWPRGGCQRSLDLRPKREVSVGDPLRRHAPMAMTLRPSAWFNRRGSSDPIGPASGLSSPRRAAISRCDFGLTTSFGISFRGADDLLSRGLLGFAANSLSAPCSITQFG